MTEKELGLMRIDIGNGNPLAVGFENTSRDHAMNANTHLRVLVSVVLTKKQLRAVCPQGYKKLARASVETECQGD